LGAAGRTLALARLLHARGSCLIVEDAQDTSPASMQLPRAV